MLGITSSLVLGTPLGTVLGPSTGGSGQRVARLLLAFGFAGTAGNLLAGARPTGSAPSGGRGRAAAPHRRPRRAPGTEGLAAGAALVMAVTGPAS
jgi:hypothetical protein